MGLFLNDIRLALRLLAKNTANMSMAIIVLALGMSISITMFNYIKGILLSSPSEIANADKLIHLSWQGSNQSPIRNLSFGAAEFEDFKQATNSFESIAYYAFSYLSALKNPGSDNFAENYNGLFVSKDFFETTGAKPLIGDLSKKSELSNGTMVISYRVWQELYAGDHDVIGKNILLAGRSNRIIAVMPEGFAFPNQNDFWQPRVFKSALKSRRRFPNLNVIGVLKREISRDQLKAELDTIAARLAVEYPESNADRVSVRIRLFTDTFINDDFRRILNALMLCSLLVLAVAAANVSNIILVFAARRSAEITMRSVLGANRSRIIYMVLLDGFILSLIALPLGVLIAAWAGRIISNVQAERFFNLPTWWQMSFDLQSVYFVTLILLLTTVLSGIIPAWRASRPYGYELLKDDSRTSSSLYIGSVSKVLLAMQIALSSLLLITALTMIYINYKYSQRPFPFDPRQVLAINLPMYVSAANESERAVKIISAVSTVMRDAKSIPGIKAVSFSNSNGVNRFGARLHFTIDGVSYDKEQDYPSSNIATIRENYFDVFGLEPLAGRAIESNDVKESQPVAVVNKSFAQRFFPGESVVGKRIQIQPSPFGAGPYAWKNEPWRTIIGVVPDIITAMPHESVSNYVQIYVPHRQRPLGQGDLLLYGDGDPYQWVASTRTIFGKYLPEHAPVYIRTLRDQLGDGLFFLRFVTALFGIFGVVALIKAFVGLYAVISFSIRQKFREIGIRFALGATGVNVMRQTLKSIAPYIIVGLVVGLAAGHFVELSVRSRFGFAQMQLGLLPYIFVVVCILITSFVAILVPTFRACRIQPASLLHEQ